MVKQDQDHKVYVLDTNVLLHEPLAYLSFQEHDVVVPMTVLEELDHIKDRKRDVSRDARVAIRGFDDVLRDATPEQMLEGVALPTLKLESHHTPSTGKLIIVNDHLFPDSISGLPGTKMITVSLIARCTCKLNTVIKKWCWSPKTLICALRPKGRG